MTLTLSYDVILVLDGEATILTPVVGVAATPRLFEGFDGGLYVYGFSIKTFRSEDTGETWDDIHPDGVGYLGAMAQTSGSDVWGGGLGQGEYSNLTLALSIANTGHYQNTPEDYSGWRETGSLVAGMEPRAAIADDSSGLLPILVGSGQKDSPHIIACSEDAPFTSWGLSESGIPDNQNITALEVQE